MTVCLLTWAERPDLAERGPASAAIWPEYNLHGDAFDDWWAPLLDALPEYQFALDDDAADVVLAEAHSGPLAWNGDDRSRPTASTPPCDSPSAATAPAARPTRLARSEEHTSELQSLTNLVCRLLLEKKKKKIIILINTKQKKK